MFKRVHLELNGYCKRPCMHIHKNPVTHFIQNAMQSMVCKNLSYFMYYSLFLSSMKANSGSNELSLNHRSFLHRTYSKRRFIE